MPKKDDQRKSVIDVLNKARSMELYAIIQYMNQHYVLDDADFGKLASAAKKIAIEEMKHAEKFAERVKELDGEPTAEIAARIVHAQKIEQIYPFDADVEADTLVKYNEFMKICRDNNDSVSATLFETIIADEQEHFNYFDDTHAHIEKLGNSFLARMTGENAD